MERILIYSLIVYAVVCVGMLLIQRFDDFPWKMHPVKKGILSIISSLNGVLLWGISVKGNKQFTTMEMILLAFFVGCLLFACVTDAEACVVFQFTWWVAVVILGIWFVEKDIGSNGIVGIIGQNTSGASELCGLGVYILLQEFFFARMYGRADCHGFAVCAVAGYLCGINMSGYVYHMAIAFGMLGVVQLLKGNVNRKGNLKHPVPFLPYITLA